jgi:disulfide oxidoreductase YuzD
MPKKLGQSLKNRIYIMLISELLEAQGAGMDQIAGIGVDCKSFRFRIRDLVALADKYPVEKIDVKQFEKQLVGRQEDPTKSIERAQQAELKYPIIVVKRKNGQLWIADGTHRAHKAILQKLSYIDAKVIPIDDMQPFAVTS